MRSRTFIQSIGLALTLAVSLSGAGTNTYAQGFPNRPVKLVVPFPPGTATDLAARMIGQQLSSALGQPFVVDNKPGAGGSIAAMDVIRSAPDGYTLLFSSNSAISSNVALLKNIPYDPNKDFSPVASIGDNMLVLMVKENFPAKNIQEFVSYAKQRPGKVSAGFGSSSSQVSIAILNKLAGLDVLAVPYKGIPLAVNDVLGGTLDFTFVDIGNAMAQSKGGRMRALGVTSAKRNVLVPDWPALSESLSGFDITAWFAIVGPAGLPREVVDKLNQTTNRILTLPEMKEKLATLGITPLPMQPDQLKAHIGSEITKWTKIVKEANIQPE